MPTATTQFSAIGTPWQIDTDRPLDRGTRGELVALIEDFDRTFSRFRDDSLVARIAQSPDGGCFEFPDVAAPLFELYDRLVDVTGGAVDPLIGRRLELLGYDAAYRLRPVADVELANERARPARWRRDVDRSHATLRTHRAVVLDVGAVGKGYLVDLVSDLLSRHGHDSSVVDAGGDLRHQGDTRLQVGLEDPADPERVVGVARLHDAALCASASNRRAWGDGLHHVLDALSGQPVREIVATWAVAPTAAVADGAATALFVTDPCRLAGFGVEFVRLHADGRIERSAGFDGELFTAPPSPAAKGAPTGPGCPPRAPVASTAEMKRSTSCTHQ